MWPAKMIIIINTMLHRQLIATVESNSIEWSRFHFRLFFLTFEVVQITEYVLVPLQ